MEDPAHQQHLSQAHYGQAMTAAAYATAVTAQISAQQQQQQQHPAHAGGSAITEQLVSAPPSATVVGHSLCQKLLWEVPSQSSGDWYWVALGRHSSVTEHNMLRDVQTGPVS